MNRLCLLLAAAAALVLAVVGAGAGSEECRTIGSMPDSLRGPRPPSRVAFGPGESLVFSVQYGLITAGTATMSIDPRIRSRQGRPTYHMVTTAESSKMFSAIFKVNDRVESYMDTLQLHSVRYEKHLREGKYTKDLWIVFDQQEHTALIDGKRRCEVEEHVQDILSSFYYVRTLDLEVGKAVYVANHDNGKNYPMEVKVHKRERISVDAGTFDCLVLEPVILGEAIFKQKGRLKVWVTDDELHMPVLMKSKVLVGAIAAVLTDFRLAGGYEKPPAMVAVK